ncbi:uncharacterized protein LOC143181411 [Calliopsis andreniformis]|uniref:uncharacterized protein LOC143181411 n=1 Tax=Calliopsis andreniformis TaxID=337506 RepID=UPI003FCD8684
MFAVDVLKNMVSIVDETTSPVIDSLFSDCQKMRVLGIVLLSILVQAHCNSLGRSVQEEETRPELDQKRSARVHRVAEDFLENEDFKAENIVESSSEDQISQNQLNLKKDIQREKEFPKELKTIFKDLSQERTIALKNIDLAINRMADTVTSPSPIKSTSKNNTALKNLLNSLEELDIYYPDGQDLEEQPKSMSSPSSAEATNGSELKTLKVMAQYLDKVLLNVQNRVIHIRNIFEKLCRKHRSKTYPRAEANDPEKLRSMNQPKKVSIL